MPILKHHCGSQIRDFKKSRERLLPRVRGGGGRQGCIKGSSMCYCAAVVGGEQRRAKSRVYLKWHKDGCLFLERWIISQQLTVCMFVCVCARACWHEFAWVSVSPSQRESGRCGLLSPTHQSSPRGQCVQREIRAERIESGQVGLKGKKKKQESRQHN